MTLFVSIASYRDTELLATIKNCLEMAYAPEDIYFGICWQHDANESMPSLFLTKQFRVVAVPWVKSGGACWARSEIMRLYDSQDYYMQIDSHHRFAPDWDRKLINYVESSSSLKPIMTAYCPAYLPGEAVESPPRPLKMDIQGFSDGIPLFKPEFFSAEEASAGNPLPASFISAHFLFTRGIFVEEVPYDRHLYFHGEEITLSARAFTWGYDLFHPPETLLWHEYSRQYRSKHWDDHGESSHVNSAWYIRDEISKRRVRRLLSGNGQEMDGYGRARTLEQYRNYVAVNLYGVSEGAAPEDFIVSGTNRDSQLFSDEHIEYLAAQNLDDPNLLFDGAFCLTNDLTDCLTHSHSPAIEWICQRVLPDQGLSGEMRRVALWRSALKISRDLRLDRVLMFADGFTPGPGLEAIGPLGIEMQGSDMSLWPSQDLLRDGEPTNGIPAATVDFAVLISKRECERMIEEIPSDPQALVGFLAMWSSLDNYILRDLTIDDLTMGPCFRKSLSGDQIGSLSSPTDRPRISPSARIFSSADGIYLDGLPIHGRLRLNNSAAQILALCDGHRTAAQIQALLVRNAGGRQLRSKEVVECLRTLHEQAAIVIAGDEAFMTGSPYVDGG